MGQGFVALALPRKARSRARGNDMDIVGAQVAEIIEVLSQESQVDEEVLFLKLQGSPFLRQM